MFIGTREAVYMFKGSGADGRACFDVYRREEVGERYLTRQCWGLAVVCRLYKDTIRNLFSLGYNLTQNHLSFVSPVAEIA